MRVTALVPYCSGHNPDAHSKPGNRPGHEHNERLGGRG